METLWSTKTLWKTPADLKAKQKKKGVALSTQKQLFTPVLQAAREIRRDIPDGFEFGLDIGRLAGVDDETAGSAHPKEETNHPTEEQNNSTEVTNHRTEERTKTPQKNNIINQN